MLPFPAESNAHICGSTSAAISPTCCAFLPIWCVSVTASTQDVCCFSTAHQIRRPSLLLPMGLAPRRHTPVPDLPSPLVGNARLPAPHPIARRRACAAAILQEDPDLTVLPSFGRSAVVSGRIGSRLPSASRSFFLHTAGLVHHQHPGQLPSRRCAIRHAAGPHPHPPLSQALTRHGAVSGHPDPLRESH